ncbi:phospholipase D-like domain-containing protein [Flammeovirga aprica]|uniref:phospholipase D n=1 Tax=Flammeovirga aprica JL-4 TaxID=694437 RepID=A0A7X9P2F9_9BACT|nr:phospholipase D-like domain-containing protein [Flammeovirga aprica]NME68090.1 hypothetical protein [Flammeovirga aprica JL-4]
MNTKSYFSDIRENIVATLSEAKDEILIAVAWFTDPIIYEALEKKVNSGVKLQLIIADNEDNKRLDFDKLSNIGANITKIGRDYGIMHHKFCVIDSKILINGSYNWTVNASKNNNENIMVIREDDQLIEDYKKQFYNLLEEVKTLNENIEVTEPISAKEEIVIQQPKTDKFEEDIKDLDFEWNLFINSQVKEIDEEELFNLGYKRAEENHGDPQIIKEELDVLYSKLLNDTQTDTGLKDKFRHKIEERTNFTINYITEEIDGKLNELEVEKVATENSVKRKITEKDGEIKTLIGSQDQIKEEKVPLIEKRIEQTKDKIEGLEESIIEIESKKFKFQKKLIIPICLLILTSIYMWVFYGSTLYTIVHGLADAQVAIDMGGNANISVFNINAFPDAIEKGFMAFVIISLFPFLPMTAAYLFESLKGFQKYFTLAFVFIIDVLMAYQIAKTMHIVNYMNGDTVQKWPEDFIDIFVYCIVDSHFWFVIFMGFMSALLWGFLYQTITPEISHKKQASKLEENKRNKQEEKLEGLEKDLEAEEDKYSALHQSLLVSKSEKSILEEEYDFIPKTFISKKTKLEELKKLRIKKVSDRKEAILHFLEREHLPVSISSLKHRFGMLKAGWNKFLKDVYSEKIAKEKTADLDEVTEKWLTAKNNDLTSEFNLTY